MHSDCVTYVWELSVGILQESMPFQETINSGFLLTYIGRRGCILGKQDMHQNKEYPRNITNTHLFGVLNLRTIICIKTTTSV